MRWTPKQAWLWHEQQPWLCGFNYVPSTAVNSTEMWQEETFDAATIERELLWAREIGFNCCRVFLQFRVWQANAQGFEARFENFLSIAARQGISVMPVFFDDCAFAGREPYLGQQDEPLPGIHNSGWTASPGRSRVLDEASWPALRHYVQSITRRFAHDERVLLWDVYNEPGNGDMGNQSLPLLRAAFAWLREVNPAQPLTAAIWHRELTELNSFSCEVSDIISFHDYNALPSTQSLIAELKAQGRPLLCTEWMSRTRDNGFETHLPLFKSENIGCFFWGLVQGRTQTNFPWGSPQNASEPELWFHDLLQTNGTPYNDIEIALIRRELLSA
jgi:hypothetical protein